ncbi:hypothetical protein Dimus_005699, partial [Dionaea muscipula]
QATHHPTLLHAMKPTYSSWQLQGLMRAAAPCAHAASSRPITADPFLVGDGDKQLRRRQVRRAVELGRPVDLNEQRSSSASSKQRLSPSPCEQ